LTKPIEIASHSNDVEANATGAAVNGISIAEAFSDNQAVEAPSIEVPLPAVESQPTEEMSSLALNSSQLPDTNTTATEEQQPSTLPDGQDPNTSSDLLASVDSAIESAMEDVAAPSTVPPVVEAQESDLRHTSSPLAQPADPEPQEQQSSMDFDLGVTEDVPQGEGIADPTAGANVSDFGFSTTGNIPNLPDFSANSQPLQDTSADFAPGISPQVETDNDATFQHDDVTMGEYGADNIKAENGPPDPTVDTSLQPPKIAREREDDDENEPSAKRAKTDEATDLDQEMADVRPVPNGESTAVQADVKQITDYQVKEIIKILKNCAKSKDGRNLIKPVAEMWPNLAESYLQRIPNPIDLATMEQKLKNSAYPSLDAVKDDARFLASNAADFNSPEHAVAISAGVARDYIITKIDNIKPEPAPAPKKEKIKREPTAVAPRTAPRRLSKGAGTNAVKASPAAPTFALDPTTSTPLIRRESTHDGGRPKREIHPPKNKDLPYSVVRPKNKKFATELKFCQEVLKELQDHKHHTFASPFYIPVDPVALGIPNYFAVIKNPMDLVTAGNKLKEGNYGNAKDFERDIRQIITNCYKFNPPGNPVRDLGTQFERLFNEQWAKKQQWLADHSPAPASPAGTPDSEDEESDGDEEEAENAPAAGGSMSAAAERLIEEQSKLIDMMKDKKASKDMIQLQHQLIDLLSAQVKDNPAQPRPAAKKVKKPRPSKSKKPAPVKKAPAPKKSGGNRQHAKYMGTLEKEVISAGIGSLPEELSSQVLEMIKAEQPGVDVSYPTYILS
jgi:bromodomain-containing factor 1